MQNFRRRLLVALIGAGYVFTASLFAQEKLKWRFGPFHKMEQPVLVPVAESSFACPVSGKAVNWESLHVYNPAAIVKDGKIWLLYRAQGEADGKFSGTSRIGLAFSEDGVHFSRLSSPVLYPDKDAMKRHEWPGGCEDPRIVEDENGTYYLTYTAYNGKIARLCVASSTDLLHWTKHGPAFAKAYYGRYLNLWSKSGAIVTELRGDRQIAKRINGKYWMYWGDSDIFIATSDNLVDWIPVEFSGMRKPRMLKQLGTGRLKRLIETRDRSFDSGLVESGPPPIATENGIVFIYNSSNRNFPDLPKWAYAAGQVLIDANDPVRVLARTDTFFISPEHEWEKTGLVNNVVFLQGLVRLQDRLFLYYGGADSVVGMARTK